MEIAIENYANDNPQARRVFVGPLTVWFSYSTPVAFKADGRPVVVRKNEWAQTTGKHLNAIDGGGKDAQKARVDGPTFRAQLQGLLARFFFPRDLDKDAPPEVVSDWLRDRDMHEAANAVMNAKK